MKVLIADDHALFRDGLSLRLEKIEPKSVIFQAANFTQALKILDDEKKIDLVILDLDMPDMNWEEGLAELRQKANGARYVIVSASEDPRNIRKSLEQEFAVIFQTFRTENSDQCPAVDFRRRNLFAAFRA
ncbi:MAG: response regulator transcription factor [Alphaproteobacteria bacterium]